MLQGKWEKLMADIAPSIQRTVTDLSQTIGPRAPGSEAELKAARYLLQRFKGIELDARLEPFASASHHATASTLTVAGASGTFASLPVQFSAGGTAEGPLLFLGSAGLLCIPTENTHGYEIVTKQAIESCAKLLAAFLKSP
jgi:hypothetical protein